MKKIWSLATAHSYHDFSQIFLKDDLQGFIGLKKQMDEQEKVRPVLMLINNIIHSCYPSSLPTFFPSCIPTPLLLSLPSSHPSFYFLPASSSLSLNHSDSLSFVNLPFCSCSQLMKHYEITSFMTLHDEFYVIQHSQKHSILSCQINV